MHEMFLSFPQDPMLIPQRFFLIIEVKGCRYRVLANNRTDLFFVLVKQGSIFIPYTKGLFIKQGLQLNMFLIQTYFIFCYKFLFMYIF